MDVLGPSEKRRVQALGPLRSRVGIDQTEREARDGADFVEISIAFAGAGRHGVQLDQRAPARVDQHTTGVDRTVRNAHGVRMAGGVEQVARHLHRLRNRETPARATSGNVGEREQSTVHAGKARREPTSDVRLVRRESVGTQDVRMIQSGGVAPATQMGREPVQQLGRTHADHTVAGDLILSRGPREPPLGQRVPRQRAFERTPRNHVARLGEGRSGRDVRPAPSQASGRR